MSGAAQVACAGGEHEPRMCRFVGAQRAFQGKAPRPVCEDEAEGYAHPERYYGPAGCAAMVRAMKAASP